MARVKSETKKQTDEEIAKKRARLADLESRAAHFWEMGIETVWDAEIERLRKEFEAIDKKSGGESDTSEVKT